MVLGILYNEPAMGITPKTPQTVVAERIEELIFQNWFLDGPFPSVSPCNITNHTN